MCIYPGGWVLLIGNALSGVIPGALEVPMSTAQSYLMNLSPSSLSAVRWAEAAASHRAAGLSPDVLVESDDLLVGALLAHPSERGEARVLLEHFGLTARDVLLDTYPKLPVADLRHRAAGLDPASEPRLGSEAMAVLDSARQLGSGRVELRHLLGALLQQTKRFRWSPAFASRGTEWTRVQSSYQQWLANGSSGHGDGLSAWLTRQNPRRPLDLPVYAPDRIDAEQDLIGIQTEADAFAYLIASCDLKPPMAVGLFGDWGSGKSFLMRAIDQRLGTITSLVEREDQRSVRVWKNIVTIEFNAWEYVQGNLWAGLLERIFSQLGSLKPRLVESWRKPAADQLARVEQVSRDLGEHLQVTAGLQGELRQKADDAQKAADQVRAAAEEEASQERERVARERARIALRRLLGRLPVLLLGRRGEDFVEALTEARAELARGNALLGVYWRRPAHVFFASVAVLLIPAVCLLLIWLNAPAAVSVLGGLAAAVPVLTSTLGMATRWGRNQLTYLEEQLAELDRVPEQVQARIDQKVSGAEKELRDAQVALAVVEEDLAATRLKQRNAEERKQRLQEELLELTPGRILVAFADKRSTEYGRRLGLLAQVRRDLRELEGEIVANNTVLRAPLPPGAADAKKTDAAKTAAALADQPNPLRDVPNRIVLYIDDLDRCPPAKVLEVLEAVHLLLSFEMFVVVVAVDSRWLTSALTDRLVALRPSQATPGQPTPKDYLEKIFQLPFWVQPLPPAGRQQLLHGLLTDSVRAPGDAVGPDRHASQPGGLHVGDPEKELVEAMLLRHGTEVRLDTSPLTLTPADLAFFETLAPLLGDTPRRIKRFVNTCQLLFAMAPPLSPQGGFPPDRAVVSLIAAISEGLPTVASYLLPALEAPTQVSLGAFLQSCPGAAADERERLSTWLAEHAQWQNVRLQSLGIRLDMIRRLRFDKPAALPAADPVSQP